MLFDKNFALNKVNRSTCTIFLVHPCIKTGPTQAAKPALSTVIPTYAGPKYHSTVKV